ncbi:hypothetical protein [Granulicella sp. S190]|uniref:hypothetical protein n=1 Tax=Granulicella sp. S190 TaxID=1747226 RepID=UPI00131B3708|nr:hypothetical protein [Granulicella sp. S190]
MKLRFVVSSMVLAITSIAAHAQVGLYINPVGINVSNSTADTGTFAFLGDNVTSRTFFGVNIGGYDDFYHGQKVDAGVDIRDSFSKANNASLNSFLIGGRVVAKLQSAFKPYGQLAVGVGSTKAPTSSVHTSRVQYGIFGGVDYTLASHVDFRAVELGYGGLSTINSTLFNETVTYSSSRLFSVSTGLVFTIP